jgi:hypothetical protein
MNQCSRIIVPVVLVALAAASGCIGETSIKFKGTVTQAKEAAASHSFDERPNPTSSAPIAGAEVNFYVAFDDISCDRAQPSMIGGDETRTRADGSYETREASFGSMWGKNTRILICVRAPDFEVYEYSTLLEQTKDPMHAEKFLNVRLRSEASK